MYVMCLFGSLPHSGDDVVDIDISVASDSSPATTPSAEQSGFTIANLGIPGSRPMSLATNVSVELGGYQVLLEDVLTWLLEAEDKLNHVPESGQSLDEVKEQFHEHESFMMELSGHQDGVGAVLSEGARLLANGGLQKDEEDEVRVQMSLLNTRWEGLRTRAMNRQSKIQQILMDMQQSQLDSLKKYLKIIEDKIISISSSEASNFTLNEQVEKLKELEKSFQEQQTMFDDLKNIIVVVDEENSVTIYTQMEEQLSALDDRWIEICRWIEEKRDKLKNLMDLWSNIITEHKRLALWWNETEITLKQWEAAPASEVGEVLDRIEKLKSLKKDMNRNEKCLDKMEKNVEALAEQEKLAETTELLVKIEKLQDQREAVGLMMEMQSERISNTGFDFDLKAATETTVTTNDWMTETVTSIAHQHDIVEKKQHNYSKKRRIGDSRLSQEFETSLLNFYKWLDYVELEVGRSKDIFDELSVEEKKIVYEESLADVEGHKKEYESIIDLGRRLVDELTSADEPFDAEIKTINSLEKRWAVQINRLDEIKEGINFLVDVKEFRAELLSLYMMVDGCSKWFEVNKGNNLIEPLRVRKKKSIYRYSCVI